MKNITLIALTFLSTNQAVARTFDIPNIECLKGITPQGAPTVIIRAPEVSYEAEITYSTTVDQDVNTNNCIEYVKGWRIETDDAFGRKHAFIFHTNDGTEGLGRAINWVPFVGRRPELRYAVRNTAYILLTAATDYRCYTKP